MLVGLKVGSECGSTLGSDFRPRGKCPKTLLWTQQGPKWLPERRRRGGGVKAPPLPTRLQSLMSGGRSRFCPSPSTREAGTVYGPGFYGLPFTQAKGGMPTTLHPRSFCLSVSKLTKPCRTAGSKTFSLPWSTASGLLPSTLQLESLLWLRQLIAGVLCWGSHTPSLASA